WRRRAVLEPPGTARGTYLTTTPSGDVAFNAESDYWLDLAVFERQVERVVALPPDEVDAEEVDRLDVVLRLHTAELLEGCFDEWALRERARVEGLYVGGLEHLMRYHRARGDTRGAIQDAQRILR